MKKIILIYLLTSIFLFSNITEKYINVLTPKSWTN